MKARGISLLVAGALASFVVLRAVTLMWPEQGSPSVQVRGDAAHFGRIPTSQPVRHQFTLTNVGKAELLIVDMKVNCECTLGRLTKKALVPGESAALDLTYTPKKAGRRQQRIVVSTNDPVHPVTVLAITADVYDPAARPTTMASTHDGGVTP